MHNLYWYYGMQTYEVNKDGVNKLVHSTEAFQGWVSRSQGNNIYFRDHVQRPSSNCFHSRHEAIQTVICITFTKLSHSYPFSYSLPQEPFLWYRLSHKNTVILDSRNLWMSQRIQSQYKSHRRNIKSPGITPAVSKACIPSGDYCNCLHVQCTQPSMHRAKHHDNSLQLTTASLYTSRHWFE